MNQAGYRDGPKHGSDSGEDHNLDAGTDPVSEGGPSLESLVAPEPTSLIGSSPATKDPVEVATRGDEADGSITSPHRSWSDSVWVSLDELDELTIVSRAQDGDPQAFEWLISAYQGGIYRLSFRMLNDRTEAEDIVQETFISAWRTLPKLAAPQAFVPWLYRNATNKCLDALRKRKRRPSEPMDTAELESANEIGGRDAVSASQSPDPAQEYENHAQMRALADLLPSVPPGPRACWLLREVHEFSYSEIAAIMQLPESTVRGRIARARRSLAEGMESWR
ncbi:RNA polymerase sigma factor [Arthrobacter sp. TMN-50]